METATGTKALPTQLHSPLGTAYLWWGATRVLELSYPSNSSNVYGFTSLQSNHFHISYNLFSWCQIRGYLPPLYRLERRWVLLYSLDQHGISLGTLYARVSQFITGGCLVAVKDGNDAIFGAWIGAGIRRSVGESYYGSGES